jgi:hypothetical protein
LITYSNAAYLAVFHARRALFPGTAQITFNRLLTGFIKADALGFKRTGFYAELAAGATFWIDVDNSFFLVQTHSYSLLGAGIIARVIDTMLASIDTVFQANCVLF